MFSKAPRCLSPRSSGALISSLSGPLVTIDNSKVTECAQAYLDSLKTEQDLSSDGVHPQEANDASVNWIFFADVLNFSFWNHEGEEKAYEVTYKVGKV